MPFLVPVKDTLRECMLSYTVIHITSDPILSVYKSTPQALTWNVWPTAARFPQQNYRQQLQRTYRAGSVGGIGLIPSSRIVQCLIYERGGLWGCADLTVWHEPVNVVSW